MCSAPKAPQAPAPLAAAPTMPLGQKPKNNKRNGQNDTIKTGARGIYQPLGGKDLLGQ